MSPLHYFKETLFKAVGKLSVDTPMAFDLKVAITVPPNVNMACLSGLDVGKEFQLASLEPLPADVDVRGEAAGDTDAAVEKDVKIET